MIEPMKSPSAFRDSAARARIPETGEAESAPARAEAESAEIGLGSCF